MTDLEDLQNTLIALYQKNRAFLEKHYPQLNNRLTTFEQKQKETQFIDFINGQFELLDKEGNKTYNCNPFYDAQERAKNIEHSQAIFSLIVEKITDKNYNEKDEVSAHQCVEEFLDIPTNQNIQKSEKFIFIGTLLGIHINDIHKQLKQKAYFILEPSLERFRLSLFLTDYVELTSSAKLFFCIEEKEHTMKELLYHFLEYEFSFNHAIKFELASEKELFLVEKLKNILTSFNPFVHAFSEDLIDLQRGNRLLEKSKNGILDYTNLKLFDNKPILILGAGPSLEKEADFIKKFHSKFLIIAASAALKRLERINVIPHIIFAIDKKEEIVKQFDVNPKYYDNAVIFLSTKIHQKVFEKLQSCHTYLLQTSCEIFPEVSTLNAVSVGDFMVSFALKCNASNLYLLGIDAAFNTATQQSHDSLHASKHVLDDKECFSVKGNFQSAIMTNTTYAEIIDSFTSMQILCDTKIFNLSSGAYLPNCLPLKTENITFNDLKNTSIQLDTFITLLSKHLILKLSEKSLATYTQEKELILTLEKSLSNSFDTELLLLYNKHPTSLCLDILYRYIKLINPYIHSIGYKKAHEIKEKQLRIIFDTLLPLFSNENY